MGNQTSRPQESPQESPQETIGQQIRSVMIQEFYRKDWLYVDLVNTDWENREEEEDYFRCDGAVDVLMEFARLRGLEDEVIGDLHPEEAGKQRLRQHMLDRQHNGPARLEELESQIQRIQREVPMNDYTRDRAERVERGYYRLCDEKHDIEGDLEITELALRYIDGEDIEPG